MDISIPLLLLFIGAFASLWIPSISYRRVLSFGLLALAGVTAILGHAIAPGGLLWVFLLLTLGRYYHHEHSQLRYSIRLIFIILLLGLGFGLLPGFEAVTLQGAQILKSGSADYSLHIRPDKVFAGFALLAFAVPLTRDPVGWRCIAAATLPLLVITALLVLAAGWLSGYVDYKPKMPEVIFFLGWGFTNLLLVTGVEEGFFRGIIQRGLTLRLKPVAAICISALLFGLAHFAGGALYIALATLAGLGYGTAYHLSGQRIEAAMLTHFGVNLFHLLLFTYPYAVTTASP